MSEINSLQKNKSKIGDAAVDGLFSGLTAGMAMGLFLLLTGLFTGVGPAVILGKFALLEGTNPLTGLLTHLAISSVYGVLFSLVFHSLARIWPWFKQPKFSSLGGLVFGSLIWILARYIFMVRAAPGLQSLSDAIFLLGHLIYGLVLGISLQRRHNEPRHA